jgi:5-methylcytosine-specific restriction endonuclease McrBC GTP-binding regulatory subunit McrB
MDSIDDFKEYLLEQIENEEKIPITPKAYIYRITEKSIRYNAENWGTNDGGVPFSDLIKMYNADLKTRKEVKELASLTKTAKSLATYWFRILELFRKFLAEKNLKPTSQGGDKTEKKSYVMIIDEINRANLPAVIGELIYALEYRGCSVNSMYAVDGDYELIIPDNLLIIGTMNTADRSVGHIDYAIRRRFAFVNVISDASVITNPKAKALFDEIAGLFTPDYIAPDYEPRDIQIGHSYFICKDDNDLLIKLKYEIIPILDEYLKDGILLAKAKEKIEEIGQYTV